MVRVREPNATLGVHADAVRIVASRREVGENPLVAKRAVPRDAVGGQAPRVALRDDERATVARDGAAVGEHERAGLLADPAVRCHENEAGGAADRHGLPAVPVRIAGVAHVGVPTTVDDHVVGITGADAAEVRVLHQAVGIEAQQLAIEHRYDEQPAVGEPAEA